MLLRGLENLEDPSRANFPKGKLQSFLPYFLCFTKSRKSVAARRRRGRGAAKGFSFVRAKLMFGCADSRLAEPRYSLQRERIVTFCIVQKVTKKHARTCKKLPVASFCASETAETGRIANGCEQDDHVSRRRRSPATHDSKLCRK